MVWPWAAIRAWMSRATDITGPWTGLELDADEQPPTSEPPQACAVELDVEDRAKSTTYRNKRRKRDRWPPVDLSARRVVIVLHQTGVQRSAARWRETMHRVTCHRGIGPDGARYRVHPLNTRLVAANRLDRAPFHAISIEIAGNFEGIDGSGKWWAPDRMGRGRASPAQIAGARQAVRDICREVSQAGGRVEAIAPHRIAGRDANGWPNRTLCPGSRVWSEVGEWASAVLGLGVPGPGVCLGGAPIPREWHGPYRHQGRFTLWRI